MLGIPGLVISWVTAIGYVPKIRGGIAAGRAAAAGDGGAGTAFRYGWRP